MKKSVAFVFATGVIGITTLLLLEVAVRIVLPQPPPSLWLQADARYGHVMRPDFQQDFPFTGSGYVMHVRTNSQGFRDAEPLPAQPGVPTIVFAGDSFTFGHGVDIDERFDTLFKVQLAQSGRAARCINIGVNAWGTLQESRYIEDHLDTLAPDIVVLTFCENDPFDDTYFLENGVSFDRVTFPGKTFLRAHSHLFRVLQEQYLLFRKRQTMAAEAAQTAAAPPPELEQAHAAPPIDDAAWQRTEGYLAGLAEALAKRNPDALLLIQATAPWDPDIAARLGEIAARHEHIEYLPLEAVAALPEGERRLAYDGHWSRRVHELAAEALFERLKTRLPAAAP